MDDNGNPAYHRPPNTPLITPERVAKGDLRIEYHEGRDGIRFAEARVHTLLELLQERGVLDHQHVQDGRTFEKWQIWFTAELSCHPSTIYSSDLRGIRRAPADDDLAHDDYGKLCRGMSRAHLACVEFAVRTPATERNGPAACRDGAQYRAAFDRLSIVMERLREAYKARKEAE